MEITQLAPAEIGWKAVFTEPDGSESLSRIVAWALAGDEAGAEVLGLIVDPASPSRIVSAVDAASPAGGEFTRYRFVAPDPTVVTVPAPPPVAPAEEDTAGELAKGFLKRRR
jgi:hypothetical protein